MTEQFAFDYNAHEHARRTDPGTSAEAAWSLTTLTSHCGALLIAYAGVGDAGLTAEGAAERAEPPLEGDPISKRNSDLARMGLIEPLIVDGEVVKRFNRSNRRAVVFRITDAGRQVVQ